MSHHKTTVQIGRLDIFIFLLFVSQFYVEKFLPSIDNKI